ncbi:MAG: hypothetical protein HZC28_05480 [Spirochaetes bacterium]|nr:hypothetical protein [Spirochaetota bacterium]
MSTFTGVVAPSLEAMLGAIIFLVMPSLVSRVGLLPMLAVIGGAAVIMSLTAVSIAACVTNLTTIGPGGIYPLARASLGRAFGGSIGIQLFLAQAATTGFVIAGFGETLYVFLSTGFAFDFGGMPPHQVKMLLSSASFLVFLLIVIIGGDFTEKLQLPILTIIIISILAVAVAVIMLPRSIHADGGITMMRRGLTAAALISVFAAFFPVVKGMTAGLGMSGDLAAPQRSIVRGTAIVIVSGIGIYIVMAYVFARISPEAILRDDFLSAAGIAKLTPLSIIVLAGILTATASAAISYLNAAPRILHAMVHDGNIPLPAALRGPLNADTAHAADLRIATLITGVCIIPVFLVGDLMVLATVVGIAFIAVYGWINCAAFLEYISRNPSFRPTSRGHWLISFAGMILCAGVIIAFNPFIACLIVLFQALLFLLLSRFSPGKASEGVWWGVVFTLMTGLSKVLGRIAQGTKNWRPVVKILAFKGDGANLRRIIAIGEMIGEYLGMVSADIFVVGEKNSGEDLPPASISQKAIPVDNPADCTENILVAAATAPFIRIAPNTILVEYHRHVKWEKFITRISQMKRNLLLYKDGVVAAAGDEYCIDVWWRGSDNGNLAAMLAHIIFISNSARRVATKVRIIRMKEKNEQGNTIRAEMNALLGKARLVGTTVLLDDQLPLVEAIRTQSSSAHLVMIGIPDTRNEIKTENVRWFWDKLYYSFDRQLSRFDDMPPILFIKAAFTPALFDE